MTTFSQNVDKYAATRGAQYLPMYKAASEKYGVPYDILVKQGAQESGFWDQQVIAGNKKSRAGAIGVGQFMPATAERFGIDPRNADQSIDAQAKYMRANYNLLGSWDKALAGYNWGEGNVQRKGMGNLPAETRDYVAKIGGSGEVPQPVDCGYNPLCWAAKAGNGIRNSIPFLDDKPFEETPLGKQYADGSILGTADSGGGLLGGLPLRIIVGVSGLVILSIGFVKLKV